MCDALFEKEKFDLYEKNELFHAQSDEVLSSKQGWAKGSFLFYLTKSDPHESNGLVISSICASIFLLNCTLYF